MTSLTCLHASLNTYLHCPDWIHVYLLVVGMQVSVWPEHNVLHLRKLKLWKDKWPTDWALHHIQTEKSCILVWLVAHAGIASWSACTMFGFHSSFYSLHEGVLENCVGSCTTFHAAFHSLQTKIWIFNNWCVSLCIVSNDYWGAWPLLRGLQHVPCFPPLNIRWMFKSATPPLGPWKQLKGQCSFFQYRIESNILWVFTKPTLKLILNSDNFPSIQVCKSCRNDPTFNVQLSWYCQHNWTTIKGQMFFCLARANNMIQN